MQEWYAGLSEASASQEDRSPGAGGRGKSSRRLTEARFANCALAEPSQRSDAEKTSSNAEIQAQTEESNGCRLGLSSPEGSRSYAEDAGTAALPTSSESLAAQLPKTGDGGRGESIEVTEEEWAGEGDAARLLTTAGDGGRIPFAGDAGQWSPKSLTHNKTLAIQFRCMPFPAKRADAPRDNTVQGNGEMRRRSARALEAGRPCMARSSRAL